MPGERVRTGTEFWSTADGALHVVLGRTHKRLDDPRMSQVVAALLDASTEGQDPGEEGARVLAASGFLAGACAACDHEHETWAELAFSRGRGDRHATLPVLRTGAVVATPAGLAARLRPHLAEMFSGSIDVASPTDTGASTAVRVFRVGDDVRTSGEPAALDVPYATGTRGLAVLAPRAHAAPPCDRCMSRWAAVELGPQHDLSDDVDIDIDIELLASLVAVTLQRFALGSLERRTALVLRAETGAVESLVVPALDDCGECRPLPVTDAGARALAYEESVARNPFANKPWTPPVRHRAVDQRWAAYGHLPAFPLDTLDDQALERSLADQRDAGVPRGTGAVVGVVDRLFRTRPGKSGPTPAWHRSVASAGGQAGVTGYLGIEAEGVRSAYVYADGRAELVATGRPTPGHGGTYAAVFVVGWDERLEPRYARSAPRLLALESGMVVAATLSALCAVPGRRVHGLPPESGWAEALNLGRGRRVYGAFRIDAEELA